MRSSIPPGVAAIKELECDSGGTDEATDEHGGVCRAPHVARSRGAPVEIVAVGHRRTLRAFIDLPRRIYRDDPAWVPPLTLERRLHFSSHNPFLRHGDWRGWLALQGDQPVGRITAQTDRLHQQRYGADTGHFGLIEAIDDAAVFEALTGAAERWLREQGVREVTGPYHFSINQECGLLVDGFATPPAVMMPHGRAWYGAHLEALGYEPCQELLAYWIETEFTHPPVMRELAQRYRERIRVRALNRRGRSAELETLREIFNDAWATNWGFVPFTQAEFAELGQILRLLVDRELVQIAELDGEPVAFIVALPDINEAARNLNGRLLPLGWWRLLWRIKRHHLRRGRIALMGVRRRYQETPLGTALAFAVIAAVQGPVRRRGIQGVELSWILAGNAGMRKILERLGSRIYKRYRLYAKSLA